jgi:predicted nucleotide-binding protein (sugar kinase/HSP70/actin superfamily)
MGNLKIGIPQALLYYEYFPLWKGFLEGLDAEVIITGPTTKLCCWNRLFSEPAGL